MVADVYSIHAYLPTPAPPSYKKRQYKQDNDKNQISPFAIFTLHQGWTWRNFLHRTTNQSICAHSHSNPGRYV